MTVPFIPPRLTPTLDSDLLESFNHFKRARSAKDEYLNLLDILKLLAPLADDSRELIEEAISETETAIENERLYRSENAAGAEADYRYDSARDAL